MAPLVTLVRDREQRRHVLSLLVIYKFNFWLSVGRFFLVRALYAITLSVLDVAVVYLWPWVLIPKH